MDDLFDLPMGGFLDGLFDPMMLREGAMASLGGLLGGTLFAATTDMVEKKDGTPFFDTPLKRGGLALGVGLLGGFGLYRFNPQVGCGFVGGMMTQVGNELYDLVQKKRTLKIAEKDAAAVVSAMTAAAGGGMSYALRDAQVFNRQPGGGYLADASVVPFDQQFDALEDEEDSSVMAAVVAI